MTVDGFITLLSLIVAVYALIPRYKQLELKLSISIRDWVIVSLVFAVVVYLQFYSFFVHQHWNPSLGFRRYGINPDRAAYLISFCAIPTLWFRVKRRPLNRTSIFRFRDFVNELISDRRWAELCSVINERMEQLFIIYNAEIFLEKLRKQLRPNWGSSLDYLTSDQFSELLHQLAEQKKATLPPRPIVQRLKRLAAFLLKPVYKLFDKIVPEYKSAQRCAREVVEEVFLSKHVVENISSYRPYLAVRMVQFPFSERGDFVDLFLRFQIKDPKSTLYKEIQRNMTTTGPTYRYIFPERNKLLVTFVKNSKLAVDLNVWRPIAEGALTFVDELYASKDDLYNEEPLDFETDSEDRKDCPIQTTLYFFDLLVTEAFYNKEPWHMWLYYMTFFTRKMLRNMSDHTWSGTRKSTRYHYLLEEIISKLTGWIELVEHSAENPEFTRLKAVDIEHENSNIPKSAIICLSSVLGEIIQSPKLSEEFKSELCEPLLGLYFKLKVEFKNGDYATVLVASLKDCGRSMGEPSSPNWEPVWRAAWGNFDKVPYMGLNGELKNLEKLLFL